MRFTCEYQRANHRHHLAMLFAGCPQAPRRLHPCSRTQVGLVRPQGEGVLQSSIIKGLVSR